MKIFKLVLVFLLATPLLAQDGISPKDTAEAAGAQTGEDMSIRRNLGRPCPDTVQTDSCLRIGVRQSARPFSYYSRTLDPVKPDPVAARTLAKSGPLRAAGFDGYMVYICDQVLRELMLTGPGLPPALTSDQIAVVEIDEIMDDPNRADRDRFTLLGDKIDILCDPASINLERVRNFAVSPPLFLTGVSYLAREGNDPPLGRDDCPGPGKALIGIVGSTNAAQHGIRAIVEADEWSQYKSSILGAIKGGSAGRSRCPDTPSETSGGYILAGKTHEEVARAFCNGDVNYYVGDLEIILEHARMEPGCDPIPAAQSFTNDRYGIFAQIDYSTPKALQIGRFFEVLNREIASSDSLLDRAYNAEFGDATKSRKLELFFWSLRGARDP
jgi:hypothetical protein